MKPEPVWRKSSRSDSGAEIECVELARLSATSIGIRDSKNPGRGHLTISRRAARELFDALRSGLYDLSSPGVLGRG